MDWPASSWPSVLRDLTCAPVYTFFPLARPLPTAPKETDPRELLDQAQKVQQSSHPHTLTLGEVTCDLPESLSTPSLGAPLEMAAPGMGRSQPLLPMRSLWKQQLEALGADHYVLTVPFLGERTRGPDWAAGWGRGLERLWRGLDQMTEVQTLIHFLSGLLSSPVPHLVFLLFMLLWYFCGSVWLSLDWARPKYGELWTGGPHGERWWPRAYRDPAIPSFCP